MEEKWKSIEGYTDYQVSNLGRVKSLKFGNERILKPNKNRCGYLKVCICKYGIKKSILIHRLVAQSFVQNDSLFNNEVNHLDENKENNCATNLQWCDRQYNCNFGTRTERLSKAQSKLVKCIETDITYPSVNEIQRQLGFSISSISRCCNGKLKSAYKLHWKWAD